MSKLTLHTTLPLPAQVQALPPYGRYTALLVLACTLLRLVLAAVVELGNDEAYYWLYTQHLQWNYFDHPPVVALWARLFSAGGLLQHYEVFVRLGSIVGCALSTFFIYKATATLHSSKAGWYAAVLYNTSFYAGMVAGLLIMPDSPQMIFWTASLWLLALLLRKEQSWKLWILFGLAAGLCIMSKVHGVFLWGGLGLFVLFQKRAWLGLPQLYVALLLTLGVCSPVFFWNAANDFVTFRFHGERVVVAGRSINWATFGAEVLGQLFFNNPVNVVLTIVALLTMLRRQKLRQSTLLLCCIGLPLAVVLLVLSLFRTVYPHWSGPAYVTLIPVTAFFLARRRWAPLFPAWLKWALGALIIFSVGWPLALRFYPGTFGSKSWAAYGSGDVTLDRYGWEAGGKAFGTFYRQEVAAGRVPPNTPVVCNTWWGAHVEYYFCRPQGIAMLGLGTLKEIHHYAWLNRLRRDAVNLNQAFCIVPSDEWYDASAHFKKYYTHIRPVKGLQISRGGQKAKVFWISHLSGWKGGLPVVK